MKFQSGLIGICLTILFIITFHLQSTANNQNTAEKYEYTGTLSYLDGTPVDMSRSNIDKFDILHIKSGTSYTPVKKLVKGAISIDLVFAGDYLMSFMGFEIAKFNVVDVDGYFRTNLSGTLSLPFNYIATTKPNQTVKIYDDNINLIETIVANEEGYAALKGNEQFFSNKFIVTEAKDHFPNPAFFKEIKSGNKGKLSYRTVRPSTQQIKAKRGLVHNISTDTYYTKREIAFSKDKKLWLLFVYEANNQKTIISKLNLAAYPKSTPSEIILDELGRPVINLKKRFGGSSNYKYQSLIVSKNGNLQVDDETFVYPTYRFKDNFVKGTSWIIPTFKDIALTEGGHNFRISCNGSWTEPNPAAEAHRKLAGEIGELVAEINKAFQEGRDIGNSKSLLLDEKREQLRNMPPAPPFKRSGSLSSSESFNVFLSPFADQLWKMTSSLDIENGNVDSIAYNVKCVKTNPAVKAWNERRNKITSNRSLDPKARQEAMEGLGSLPTPSCLKYDSTAFYYTRRYRPSGYDPESDLAIKNIGITDCIIELDGNAFDYSYKDLYGCRGISYMDFDSDEDRKEAAEACFRNAPVNMGFEGEMESGYDGWGKNIDLFDKSWNLISNEPINSWEGPYPELRYGFREILGQYASMKEAREHCKSPRYNNRNKKYECYEEKVITICFDNYQFSVDENGRIQTNYDALYCGEMDPEESNLKGDQIVVEFSAKGYLTTTRALEKRILEADNILLSGHVTDKDGIEIDSAQIKLKGIDGASVTDETGTYHLTAKAQGEESYSEVMDIKLQKIALEITHEELGEYEEDKPFGLVSDGFTTLKLKVKAKGIRPQTVIVKQPKLGNFVEQSVLKLALVLDSNGEGEMEYVPPAYITKDQLTKHLQTNVSPNDQYGLLSQIWVAEDPIEITYEDEEGNPGSMTLNIIVSRPPVFLMHGFTGDESTWATLGNYLRVRKYETYAREYYQGPADESTIQRQSEKLGFYIQKIRESYKAINILLTRIDIVAHSMGGLMSRYYINNMSKYGKKAGVVIPYDVKLSREQLAAARNKAPVNLIDVRKLIMVGTPNHGASKIDELFGVLGALSSDYHQLANAQLRSDSEFFKILNAGENEGRHLDPNVQYALLYGIRKRSEFYPPDRLFYPWQTSQKNFADDDGVVKISSAILNGILNIPFPKDWFAMNGFIHSPAMAGPFMFMGDDPITESTSIFEEINILLQEDIKRTPLKNSYAKIIRSDGEAFMKYFATENWKAIGPNPLKLRDHWCQIKTDEGSANLGFFLDGHHWGSLHVQANTIVFYEYASPEFVKVYLQKGKARFRSRKKGGGGFEVVMGEEGEKWYEFNPKAKVRDVNTDFIVEEGVSLSVQSINGKVQIGVAPQDSLRITFKEIITNEGISINGADIADNPLPESGWWSSIDTTYLPNESLEPVGATIIQEDFSVQNSNWDASKISPEMIDEKLYWNVGEYNSLTHNTPIPLQNIIIEFDGWTDKNGISLEWFNDDIKGYNVAIGAYFNTKSALGFKDKDTFEFSWFPGAHLKLGTWQHYKFVLSKNKLEAYLDGNLIGRKTIYQSLGGEGKLSFFSYQSRIGIDNIHVYRGSSSVLSTAQLSQQNLLINGSFEEGMNINSYLTMRAGTSIPGWKVTKETVDLTGNYFKASDGKRSFDLIGTPGLGAIEQTIKTTPGQSYQVTFDLAGNPIGGPAVKRMKVFAGTQSAEFEFDASGKSTQAMGWEEKSWIFIAEDDETTLTFEAIQGETASNYGAAIDKVSVVSYSDNFTFVKTKEVKKEIPIQNLGDVEVISKDIYLPISGFTHLEVNAKNDLGAALESPYEVNISLQNPELLPFIDITNPKGFIDNSGNYKYDITISEPNLEDFNSLKEIPLEATFIVQIIHPQTKAIEFEKNITIPLGMTLIQGQTIGSDYKARQEPMPPEFYNTNYQIANQTDEQGNFYILFNTTLFEKDIDKYKKLAKRTQQIFSMDQFEFYLQWSASCSLPLKYMLPDSIKSKLKVATKVIIGRDGLIDLLSPIEHEQRIKQKVTQFIERMPLKAEKKSFVLGKLDRLIFRYSGTTEIPVFTDNLTFSNVIEVPSTRELYWSSEFLNGENNPTFTLMMHVMGHFLHHAITLPEHRYYNFLSKKCMGSEKIWTHQRDLLKYMFDKSEYTSFSEAGADFFNYLMFKFIEQSDQDFVNKSIYYRPGYLTQFANSTKAMEAKQKYPTYAVSGTQTAFLINYYGSNATNNPTRVYSDFLLNQTLYAVYTKGGDPASTINEWLVTKRQSYASEYLDGNSNPFGAASQFSLPLENWRVSLIPMKDFSSASVDINGNLVSNFSQIPSVSIKPNSTINIENGRFNLIAIYNDSIMVIELEPKCKIEIGDKHSIKLLKGNFNFKSPLNFQTKLARFNPRSSNFNIKLEPDLTTIIVFEGEVKLSSDEDADVIRAGQSSTMNKKGKIKKPRAMKKIPVQAAPKVVEVPFRVYR